ncbi:MAG TPA: hypothetical protein VN893_02160 [Bryobacteraceae bacterium]|nr:hypothetical protein [Bryobacteraceae bacterium]
MKEFGGQPIRVFVVWEAVLPTDWTAPSTSTLRRISDTRAAQFWDKGRLLSRAMGERDRRSIVWDQIIVYPRQAVWTQVPPPPSYRGGPVLEAIERARAEIRRALAAP